MIGRHAKAATTFRHETEVIMRQDFLRLAMLGAETIASQKTITTLGTRYPSIDFTDPARATQYNYNLYDGAAGVGIAFHDLANATGETSWQELSDAISSGLVTTSGAQMPLPRGLYSGFDGVALFHLIRGHERSDAKELEHACKLADRLATQPVVNCDLLAGAAGQGMVQIAFYRATGINDFLENALSTFTFLNEHAIQHPIGTTWPLAHDEKGFQTGLAHGTAGQLLFLSELSTLSDNTQVHKLRDQALAWLDQYGTAQSNWLKWPDQTGLKQRFRHHWCHGSTGISQAYLRHYMATKDARSLGKALAAATWTWKKECRKSNEKTIVCHGTAGSIELFLDLHACNHEAIWLQRAEGLAIQKIFPTVIPTTPSAVINEHRLGGSGSGLMLGTAGIVRQLLRLAGKNVHPILTWPESSTCQKEKAEDALSHAIPIHLNEDHSAKFMAIRKLESLRELVPLATVPISIKQPDPERTEAREQHKPAPRQLITGPISDALLPQVLEALEHSPAGHAWAESVLRIDAECQQWYAEYAKILLKQALTPASFGILLRELAGAALEASCQPDQLLRTARHRGRQALRSINVMLERLSLDLNHFLASIVSGKVVQISILGGDAHRDGEHVVLLRFENGPRLLYKPRSVLIDRQLAGTSLPGEEATLAELARSWLVPAVRDGMLPTHQIIACGCSHGYVEQIHTDPKAIDAAGHGHPVSVEDGTQGQPHVSHLSGGDESRYWYSAGLLAGHAFSFGIQDLHIENVICGYSNSTNHLSLHAVDLEIAFGCVNNLSDTSLTSPQNKGSDSEARPHSHAGLDTCLDLQCGLGAEEWTLRLDEVTSQAVAKARSAVTWVYPHLAINSHGSFKPDQELGVFLKGMADQWWCLQQHSRKIASHLRKHLDQAPVRFLAKNTRSYNLALEQQKSGEFHADRSLHGPEWPLGLPISPSELIQLTNLDYPYFYRQLTECSAEARRTWFLNPVTKSPALAEEWGELDRVHSPFWTIIKRQTPLRLAAALIDAATHFGPKSNFDLYNPDLGVRVQRSESGDLLIGLILGGAKKHRLICRLFADQQIGYGWT